MRLTRTRTIASAIALAALLPLASSALAQQKIEQQMTYEQFKAAGLDQLSPQQLANLNAWLDGKLQVETAKAVETAAAAGVAAKATDDDRRGLFAPRESREPISAKVQGDFTGFGKGRQFTLDNGQVWRQVDDASIGGANLPSPAIKITPSVIGGAWYMSVDGYNTRAKVQRVK